MNRFFLITGILILTIFFLACKSQDYKNYSTPLIELLDSLNIDGSDLEVLIDKSEYKLSLKSANVIIKEYPVVFGGNPIDDKLREGDQCTPEGDFTMVSKYPHRSWSKFIWINYPTSESWEKHRKAKSELTIDKSASIGGEIGIHGVPEGMDNAIDVKYNWTLGCISMKNKDVNEIYPYIRENTTIHIQK